MVMEALEISTGNATLDEIALSSGGGTPIRLVEWSVMFGVAVVMTVLRTYARTSKNGWNGMAWDDHLVWLALAAYAVLALNVFTIDVVAEGLSNNGMTDEHRWLLANDGTYSQEYQLRVLGSKAQLVKWFLYALTLWLLKGSLLYFFSGRLTSNMPGAKPRAWVGAGFLLLTWAATSVTVLASCQPLTNYWQIFPDPGTMCQPAISPILIAVFLGCNVITDVYLISIPIPVLLKARLRSSQKISLICLFSCTILITGISIVRALFMLKDPKINGDGMWDVRETFVALVTTNIPPIVPLLRSWFACCLGRPQVASIDVAANSDDRGSTSFRGRISESSEESNEFKQQQQQQHHHQQQPPDQHQDVQTTMTDLERKASNSTFRSVSVYSQDTDVEEARPQADAIGPYGASAFGRGFDGAAEGQQSPVWFRREAMRRQIFPDVDTRPALRIETQRQARAQPRSRANVPSWPLVSNRRA